MLFPLTINRQIVSKFNIIFTYIGNRWLYYHFRNIKTQEISLMYPLTTVYSSILLSRNNHFINSTYSFLNFLYELTYRIFVCVRYDFSTSIVIYVFLCSLPFSLNSLSLTVQCCQTSPVIQYLVILLLKKHWDCFLFLLLQTLL